MRFIKLFKPALVFTAILSGGGYITGREIAEYFLAFGSNAYWALAITFITFVITSYLTIQAVVATNSFSYEQFGRVLLGKYGFALESLFVAISLIALSVVVSGSISSIEDTYQISSVLPLLVVFGIIVGFVAAGEKYILAYESVGTIILLLFFIFVFGRFHESLNFKLPDSSSLISSSIFSGLKYAAYNAVVFPAILFSMRNIDNRQESVIASVFLGIMGIIPIFVSIVLLSSGDADVQNAKVPLLTFLEGSQSKAFVTAFNFILIFTLIDTALGLIHAISHRYSKKAKSSSRGFTVALTIFILLIAVALSHFGIVDLVAHGYGTASYALMVVFIGPLLIYSLKTRRKK